MVKRKYWYSFHREHLIVATSLMESLLDRMNSINEMKDFKIFFNELQREYFTRFIFESNNIEREGLPEVDTKKLVLDLFKKTELNEHLKYLTDTLFKVKYDIRVYEKLNGDLKSFSEIENYEILLKHGTKKKDLNLVLNSLKTLIEARNYISAYLSDETNLLLKDLDLEIDYDKLNEFVDSINKNISQDEFEKKLKDVTKGWEKNNLKELSRVFNEFPNGFGNVAIRLIRALKNENDDGKYLIDEEKIKKLHEILSMHIENENKNIPGKYRQESACIDVDTPFLPYVAIESAMAKLIEDHKIRFRKKHYNPFIEATKLSGDFVLIHPFADFNGRVSRILMNLIIQLEQIPFYLILRSNAKDKNRYLTAMKHYYRGNPKSYLALISKVFIEEISSINAKLKIANMNPIMPKKLNDKQLELIDKALKELDNESYKFR